MSEMNIRILGILSLIIIMASCQESKEELLFENVDATTIGINFTNRLHENDSLNIIQYLYFYNGSGLAAGDINNDGLTDLYFGSNEGISRLYLNKTENGILKFEDITVSAGLDKIGGWTTGIIMVDVNGDNKLDIYICQVNYKAIKGKNRLFINTSDENGVSFSDNTTAYGLDFQGLSTQASFFDYDRDGDLDMYLLNHSVHEAENYTNSSIREVSDENGDKFFRNDNGHYANITEDVNIYSSKIGFGLGMSISDLNNDGYPDMYIGNDFHENDYLYINQRNGTFKEVIRACVGHSSQFSMGTDIADINNDGLEDIVSLDMMPEDEVVKRSSVPADNYNIYVFKNSYGYHHQSPHNALQLNRGIDQNGLPIFSEVSELWDIEDTDWSWSPLIADFNNDGRKDIFITNGIVRRPNDLDYLNYISNEQVQSNASDADLIAKMPSGEVSNYLFLNREDRFHNSSTLISQNQSNISTAAIYADLDNDGDLDIVTNNINAPAGILINKSVEPSLKIKLIGENSNTDAIGTSLAIHINGVLIKYENYHAHGFMSSSVGTIHTGISDWSLIDSMTVIWPAGKITKVKGPISKNVLTLKEEDSEVANYRNAKIAALFSMNDSLFDFTHQENNFIDATFEKLIPWMLSTQGPALAVADVNGDGYEDVYFGGASGQAGSLYLQSSDGRFTRNGQELFEKEAYFEDIDAIFFDIDNDNDQDLYVVSGGNEAILDSPLLLDRLYVNDGNGNYSRNLNALPLITENGSSVSAGDYDNDGDLDLVIGSTVYAKNYGLSKGGNILVNMGDGSFQDGTKLLAPELKEIGMITDIKWADMDNDKDLDIILLGEWMPVTIFENNNGRFNKITIENSVGLWHELNITDIDGDGKLDILAGNYGVNSYLAQHGPTGILVGDYDNNTSLEPLLYYTRNGKRHPLASKDLLTSQMSYFKKLHPDYRSFAAASLDDMFGPVLAKTIKQAEIQEWKTTWFKNMGDNKFLEQSLPAEAQYSPIYASVIDDFNNDNRSDILIGGNHYEISPYIGRADASYGSLLMQVDNDQFKDSPIEVSGILIRGQVREMKTINIAGKKCILIARNNDVPIVLLPN
jgi:hypothetical protein